MIDFLLILLGFLKTGRGWLPPGCFAFWGSPGCPPATEVCYECSEVNFMLDPELYPPLEPGETPGTCISNFGGDEIPRMLVVVSQGFNNDFNCSTTECIEQFLNNPGVGLTFFCLRYSTDEGDVWADYHGGSSIYRGLNSDCNGGEYYLAYGQGFGDWIRYIANSSGLITMLAPIDLGNDGDTAGRHYVRMNVTCWQKNTPYYHGPSATCAWATCCYCEVGELPHDCIQVELYCDDDIDDYDLCLGVGTDARKFDHRTFIVYPIVAEALSCCQHGPYCPDSIFMEEDPDSKGTCCVTATFAGIKAPSQEICFLGQIENFPNLDNVAVRYQHFSWNYWRTNPWGCMGPFPTDLTITSSIENSTVYTDPQCLCTRYIISLYGSDLVFLEVGYPVVREILFSKTIDIEKVNQWAPYPHRLLKSDLAGITLTATGMTNLDIGRSLDFSEATVTLDIGTEEGEAVAFGDCANEISTNPFETVDSWELRFTPNQHSVLYYDENYYDIPSTGIVNTRRWNVPLADARYWPMFDSINPPVEFEFEISGGVGTYSRGSGPNNEADPSAHRVAVTCDLESKSITLTNIMEAINNCTDVDFFMVAWEATADCKETLLLLIESVNDEFHQWFDGIIPSGTLLITAVDEDGQIFNAGTMRIGEPWFTSYRTLTYEDTVIDPLQDGETLTLDDGVNEPTVFEFNSVDSVEEGHVAVEIGHTQRGTMANLVEAINDAADLDIRAEAADPPQLVCEEVTCTLWQTNEDDEEEQVGTIRMSEDWLDFDSETGEVVVTMDQTGVFGEYWHAGCFPCTVWVRSDIRRTNAWIVQLIYDFCQVGNLHYSFCVTGGYQPSVLSCTVDDDWEVCGYQNDTTFSLVPHYVE
jgi:hypothetical protein